MGATANEIYERLDHFCAEGDRTYPPVFVGRDEELAVLDRTIRAVAGGATRGQTTVVQGVPGVGKTALLNHLRKLHAADPKSRVVVVVANPTVLDAKPVLVIANLTEQVPSRMDVAAELAGGEFAGRLVKAGRDFAEAVVGLTKDRTLRNRINGMLGLDETSSLEQCLEAYAGRVWAKGTTVVLGIDEFQTCPDTPDTRNALTALHLGEHPVPVALLCFGLQNSRARLSELGVSRLAGRHLVELGRLSPGEGEQTMFSTLEAFGVSESNGAWRAHVAARGLDATSWTSWFRDTVRSLASDALEFPHHVNNAIRALCEVLIEHADGGDFDLGLASEIGRRAHAYRVEYYNGRLEAVADHTIALGAVARQLRDGNSDAVPEDSVLAAIRASDNFGDPLARETARVVFSEAVAKGVLTRTIPDDSGLSGVGILIPSMRAHMAGIFDAAERQGRAAVEPVLKALTR